MTPLKPKPLTAKAFAPFGDVIALQDTPDFMINNAMCARHHDLADMDFVDGRAGISLFHGQPYALPLTLKMMERHPLGSQAFIPLSAEPFLVIVAPDDGYAPATPLVFLTDGAQGVNYHCNIWHGVLTPIKQPQVFVVIDRIGGGDNLVEHHFDTGFSINI
ncbi:MAG: ureidoglycolate lyase [Paracoccaceae bacterium]